MKPRTSSACRTKTNEALAATLSAKLKTLEQKNVEFTSNVISTMKFYKQTIDLKFCEDNPRFRSDVEDLSETIERDIRYLSNFSGQIASRYNSHELEVCLQDTKKELIETLKHNQNNFKATVKTVNQSFNSLSEHMSSVIRQQPEKEQENTIKILRNKMSYLVKGIRKFVDNDQSPRNAKLSLSKKLDEIQDDSKVECLNEESNSYLKCKLKRMQDGISKYESVFDSMKDWVISYIDEKFTELQFKIDKLRSVLRKKEGDLNELETQVSKVRSIQANYSDNHQMQERFERIEIENKALLVSLQAEKEEKKRIATESEKSIKDLQDFSDRLARQYAISKNKLDHITHQKSNSSKSTRENFNEQSIEIMNLKSSIALKEDDVKEILIQNDSIYKSLIHEFQTQIGNKISDIDSKLKYCFFVLENYTQTKLEVTWDQIKHYEETNSASLKEKYDKLLEKYEELKEQDDQNIQHVRQFEELVIDYQAKLTEKVQEINENKKIIQELQSFKDTHREKEQTHTEDLAFTESEIIQKQNDIEALNKKKDFEKNEMSRKLDELAVIENELEEKEREIVKRENEILHMKKDLDSILNEIKSREQNLNSKTKELKEKELSLDQKERDLNSFEENLHKFEGDLKQKEEELELNQQSQSSQKQKDTNELSEHKRYLQEKESELIQIEQNVKLTISDLQHRESLLAEKENDCETQISEIQNIKTNILAQESKLGAKEVKFEQEVLEVKQQLNIRENQISLKMNEIDARESEIDKEKIVLNDQRKKLDSEISRAEEERKNFESKVINFESKKSKFKLKQTDYSNKHAEFSTKQSLLARKEADLVTKESDLGKKESVLEAKESDLATKELYIETKKLESTTKESDWESKRSNLETKELNLHAKQLNLQTKESDLQAKESDLQTRMSNLETKELNLQTKELNLQEKELKLSEKEEEIAMAQTKIDEELSELKEKESELNSKGQNLEEKAAILDEKESELNKIKSAQLEKDTRFQEQEELNEKIEELNQELKNRSSQISALESANELLQSQIEEDPSETPKKAIGILQSQNEYLEAKLEEEEAISKENQSLVLKTLQHLNSLNALIESQAMLLSEKEFHIEYLQKSASPAYDPSDECLMTVHSDDSSTIQAWQESLQEEQLISRKHEQQIKYLKQCIRDMENQVKLGSNLNFDHLNDLLYKLFKILPSIDDEAENIMRIIMEMLNFSRTQIREVNRRNMSSRSSKILGFFRKPN